MGQNLEIYDKVFNHLYYKDTGIDGCYELVFKKLGDKRGYYMSRTIDELRKLGFNEFGQDAESFSQKGVLRGLHFQRNPYCQAKLVRCTKGRVIDIIVDMREDSPTYGKVVMVPLSPRKDNMVFVPRGCAHGFVVVQKNSVFSYIVDNEYQPEYEGGINYNDPALGLDLEPIKKKYKFDEFITSPKDALWPTLEETKGTFKKAPTKIMVTGASGQVGSDIVKELRARGERDILALSSKDLDITDDAAVESMIKHYKPDVIIHCAAYTNVDKADDGREGLENAGKTNIQATERLAKAARRLKAKFIYLSTDYIFDGKADKPYTEKDTPNPLSRYGYTKYVGEEKTKICPKHFIARLSCVFGENSRNNFVDAMIKFSELKKIDVVKDQVSCTTYTKDLAKKIARMVYSDKYGTYNLTSSDAVSRSDLAKMVFEEIGSKTKVNEVTTEEFNKKRMEDAKSNGEHLVIAERPLYSALDTKKADAVFGASRTTKEMLKDYIKEITESNKIKILKERAYKNQENVKEYQRQQSYLKSIAKG